MTQHEYQRNGFTRLYRTKPELPSNSEAGNMSGLAQKTHYRHARPRAGTAERLMLGEIARTKVETLQAVRRVFDVLCSAAGLAILAPLFAVIALAIKLDDEGPILYSQVRIGKNLRPFRFLKFRSMKSCSAGGSPVTAPHDARVTRVGRFLRKYKLDELPQLVNVLKGDMRFVGVRPQLEKHVALFRAEYEELLQSPPGITDLASLTFRHEELFFHEGSIEEQYVRIIMPVKLRLALNYSRARTCRSDFEIIVRTVLGLGAPPGAWKDAPLIPGVQSLPE